MRVPALVPEPFFTGPNPGHQPSRRLLLISYHFPPSSAAGALRWGKLASLAAERGWGLDVITLAPQNVESPSEGSLTDLPLGTQVYAVPMPVLRRQGLARAVMRLLRRVTRSVRPHREPVSVRPGVDTTAIGTSSPAPVVFPPRPPWWSRAWGAWLDYALSARWSRQAATAGRRLVVPGRYHAIVSCGPPHMVHVAAHHLATACGLPHVMDLRDPWRLVERLADSIDSPLWRFLAEWHERRVIPEAALVVMNTEPARDAMRRAYPGQDTKVIAISNGYDDDPPVVQARPQAFTITYSGSIYLDRDPRPLFEAARQVIDTRKLGPNQFRIVLVGNVECSRGIATAALAQATGVDEHLTLLPHAPRADLQPLLGRSTVLVSLPQDSHLAVPSKLFEYMQFDAWILALSEPHSATARLLMDSDAAVVPPYAVDRIAHVILSWYDRFYAGEQPVRLAVDPRFSRRARSALLWDSLDRLTSCQDSNPPPCLPS